MKSKIRDIIITVLSKLVKPLLASQLKENEIMQKRMTIEKAIFGRYLKRADGESKFFWKEMRRLT